MGQALNWPIIGTFLLAVLLHSLWNIFGSISAVLGQAFILIDIIGLVAVAGVSLWLLILRMREADRSRKAAAPAIS